MSALAPGMLRASSRPGVILAVAGGRLLWGLCLAYPLASLLGSSGVGQRAEGDRWLFEGGGFLLLELARLQGPALLSVASGLWPVLALGLSFTALGNAVLLAALSDGEARARRLLATALARLPTLVLIGVLAALAQLSLLLFASAAVEAVPQPPARPVAATAGQAAVWLVAALLAGAIGGVADVAKASSVRAETGLAGALARARRCLIHRPVFACFGWMPYALAFLSLAAAAAELTELFDVSRPGAWRVLAVFGVHQLVVLASVALRAAWYARALCFVSTTRA